MVNKKWLGISFCCSFITVYLINLAYASSVFFLNEEYDKEIPMTTTMNQTVAALSSFSSGSGLFLVISGVAILLIILLIIGSFKSMSAAIW